MSKNKPFISLLVILILGALVITAYSSSEAENSHNHEENATNDKHNEHDEHDEHGEHGDHDKHDDHAHSAEAVELSLPELSELDLAGERLSVVATTSIIADVVAEVGGDVIELTGLIGLGQDPHSYEPAARDLTTVVEADVVFVNGWDLEEGLVDDLENISEDVPIVSISAHIDPLSFGGDDGPADPHVWFNLAHVTQWVSNVKTVLSELDPANAESYHENADAYLAELEELADYSEMRLGAIAEGNRFLITNHNSFSYFADAYDLTVLGSVIPSASTVAEPSASDLAELIDLMKANGVCTVFTETTVSDTLAQTVAEELSTCEAVQVLSLYTGALGEAGSGADSFIGMFRANVDTIVTGLK